MYVSAHGRFGTADISTCGRFGTVDISAQWTFRHGDFSALDVLARVFWAHFSWRIFCRGHFRTGHFGTEILAHLCKVLEIQHFWQSQILINRPFWVEILPYLYPTIPSQVKVMQGCFFLSSPLHIIIISQALWRLSQNQPLQLDLISFWAGIWTSGKFRGAFGPIIQYFLSLHWTVSPRFFVHHKIRPDYWFE